MKRERLESQDMLKAQDAAEEIMEASNDETVALLTQEMIERVDEEQKEREEEAKEAEKYLELHLGVCRAKDTTEEDLKELLKTHCIIITKE